MSEPVIKSTKSTQLNAAQILSDRGYTNILNKLAPESIKTWQPSTLITKEALELTPNIDTDSDVISAESEKNVFLFFLIKPEADVTLTQYTLSSAEIFLNLEEKLESTKPFIFIADFDNCPIGLKINSQALRKESREAARLPEHFFILTQFGDNNPIVNKFLSIIDDIGAYFSKDKIHFLNSDEKSKVIELI